MESTSCVLYSLQTPYPFSPFCWIFGSRRFWRILQLRLLGWKVRDSFSSIPCLQHSVEYRSVDHPRGFPEDIQPLEHLLHVPPSNGSFLIMSLVLVAAFDSHGLCWVGN